MMTAVRCCFLREQDVHGGASGCWLLGGGAARAVLRPRMERGELKRVLFMSTGALLSTVSPFQGESIPGIAHAICLEVE